MSANILIEICCRCVFVHRDDRHATSKQRKLHYHWMPKDGEIVKNTYALHATICVGCINNKSVDWECYIQQRKLTPKKYYVKHSYNAALPEHLTNTFDDWYYSYAKHFEV